ncbi:copper chaperone PCu(A)C [Sagittula sp. SSi028]|uniref:copper chaperone PCu(A)C n=1 Tax=Sagittula sp. SSi028 TaxID=3400636 RepID=UPI003AF81148
MKTLITSAVALCFALPAFAEISVSDAYARASSPTAKAGAAFMMIENTGAEEDRLLSAESDVAARVELHTHKDLGDGVMKMMHVEEGFVIPAGGMHALKRGGDHVMFMGLNRSLTEGESVSVTLTFEQAGEVTVEVPVDLTRQDSHGMDHSGHGGDHSGHDGDHADHGDDHSGH